MPFDRLKRREFITLLGGAAAWPLAARAQQGAMLVIGYLNNGSPESDSHRLTGVRRGLNQTGYVEGWNLVIEYRWAANQADRLPALHDLVPSIATIGFLENPNNPASEQTARDVQAAAPTLGLEVQILKASSDREIDAAFVSLVQSRTGALLVGNDALFNSRIEQLVALAARHAIPAIYPNREFAAAGGLMSYGASLTEEYRQVGLYAGRILKGERPADLPVMQRTKVELIINLKTAKMLGLDVPPTLLALADEVIE
jgi:putative ABC transport system substrate-binding protein